MDILLLSIALLCLLAAGAGFCLLISSGGLRFAPAELFALSFLLGAAVISLASFVLGFWVSGASLLWSVIACCLLLGCAGAWRQSWPYMRHALWPATGTDWLLLAFNTILTVVITWLGFSRVLGWDGAFNFESKARIAFFNGGVIPPEFFSDPSRTWTLQSYPLLLPLTESWLYQWLGRADQQLVKILFVLFFVAALSLLHSGARRLGVTGWRRFIAPLLLCTAPLMLVGDGSASSGYADFPLAVFYLAAVIWLLEFWRSRNAGSLRLASALLAAACWLKQEGAVLLLAAVIIAGLHLWQSGQWRRQWQTLVTLALPGLTIIAGWQFCIHRTHSLNISQFSSVNGDTLQANFWRIPSIAVGACGELLNWRHWGAFWLAVLAAVIVAWWRGKCIRKLLPLLVLLPVTIYASVYIFSLWPSFLTHLESSFPRLLIHVALVGALLVASTPPTWTKDWPESNP